MTVPSDGAAPGFSPRATANAIDGTRCDSLPVAGEPAAKPASPARRSRRSCVVAPEHAANSACDLRFRDFASASSDWFWEMDADLRFTWFSQESELRGGISTGRLIGRRRTDVACVTDDPEKWQQHARDLAAHRAFRDFRYRIITDNGKEAFFSTSGVPIFDAKGTFRGYRGTGSNVTGQVIAERKAAEAQQRLADAIETFTCSFALFDADDRLVLCNESFRRAMSDIERVLSAGERFEVIFQSLFVAGSIRVAGSEPEAWLQDWLAERTRSPNTLRSCQQSCGGSWIELRDYATRDGGRVLIRSDITQQKAAEEALRKSEASLANAQRIAKLGNWDLRISSNEMWWSDEIFRIFGHEPRAFLPSFDAFLEAIHPHDRATVRAALEAALYCGAPYRLEHRVVRPNGSERIVAQEGEVSFDADGTPLLMRATVQDVTESRLTERALREAEQRFQIAFQTCPDSISITRLRDGTYVYVNDGFTEFSGYHREEVTGRTSVSLGIWLDVKDREAMVAQLNRDGEFRNREVAFRIKSGEVRTGLSSANVCVIDGEPHIFAYIKDITARKQTERELRTLSHAVEQSSAAVVITDEAGHIQYVNQMFTTITGYQPREVIGRTPRILKSGTTSHQTYRELWSRVTSGHNWRGELCNRRKDGRAYWANALISPVRDSGGELRNFIGVQVDITEQKLAEEELRASEERFRSLVESALLGLAIERNGEALFVNHTFAAIFGYQSSAEIMALPSMAALFAEDDWQRAHQALRSAGTGYCSAAHQELRGRRKDGSLIWVHTQLQPIPWNSGGIANQLIVVDITLRKLYEEQLRHQASFDPVTDLPNRMLALDRLRTAIAAARRRSRKIATLFVDVDHFKKINDTLGHSAGDRFLRQLALRLVDAVRAEDTVARLGGDEFFLILPEVTGRNDAEVVADKILADIARPFVLEGQELFVTVSIGICLFPDDGEDADLLLRRADAAMYLAKEKGRGAARFFTSELNERISQRLRVEATLRHALDRNELSLAFQPLIDLRSNEIVGAETLLRWTSGVLGRVSPDQFIQVAEDTGLIVPIGEWVLHSACRQARLWRDAGFDGLRLSVNVSSRQFRGPSLVEALRRALADNALASNCIELEITESLLMEDVAEVEATLRQLESCGIRIAVDDFGTGYSSLSYLNRFPLDTLKIDRSFVAGLTANAAQVSLVEAIIVMAHRLSLTVVAEGVETRDQLAFLREHDCDIGQGYYFSPPLAADDFLNFVRTWRTGIARRAG
jgi:diguanylate cyclase (GGDEF)-like protein/PAS domain S-box-containing protein